MILKRYNHIFYLTVRTLNWCSNNIIARPLITIMKVLSVSDNRIEAVRKSHLQPTANYDNGTNIHFAFRLMLWSFTCIILTIELLILRTIQDRLWSFPWVLVISTAVIFSIGFNYFILWRKDKYEAYFKEFRTERRTKIDFIVATIYHLTITTICFWTALTI